MPAATTEVFPTLAALSRAAADRTADLIRDALAERDVFRLVLAGGGTPRAYHQALAALDPGRIDWRRVHIYWGDERFVPLDDADSNYRMARETLLDRVSIPPTNVHPFPVDAPTPEAAADRYEALLHAHLGDDPAETFDLALLGLGGDGHTASLFPGSPALDVADRWVVHTVSPPTSPIDDRLTLTYPALAKSRRVFFLAAGDGKRETVREILEAGADYPAGRVTARDEVVWYLDEAAAGR